MNQAKLFAMLRVFRAELVILLAKPRQLRTVAGVTLLHHVLFLVDQFEHHGRALLFQVRHMRLSGRLFFDMLDIRLSGFQLLLVICLSFQIFSLPLFRLALMLFLFLGKCRSGFFELAGIFGFLRGVLFKIFFQPGNFAQKFFIFIFNLNKRLSRKN